MEGVVFSPLLEVLAGCVFFIVLKWNESQIWFMLCFGIYGHGGCFSSILATLFLFFLCLPDTDFLQIALTHNQRSRHNHITFSSCLDAWWPGPSSCLLVISYRTSIIAYVLLSVYFFYKCQKGHAICKPKQEGLKTKLFWLFNKISSFL